MKKIMNLYRVTPREDIESAVQAERNAGSTDTTTDILLAKVRHAMATTNEHLTEGREGEALVTEKTLEKWQKLYADSLIYDHVDQLGTMPVKDAWKQYLSDQTVKGHKAKFDQKSNQYALSESAYYLAPYNAMETLLMPAELNGVVDAVCIFMDNIITLRAKGDGMHLSKKSLDPSYLDLKKRMGWSGVKSNKELEAQAQAVLKFIFGKDSTMKLIGPDLRYLFESVSTTTDKANESGGYKGVSVQTFCNKFFRAVYTRLNNLPYAFQMDKSMTGKALTISENKDMAEPPAKKEETPVVLSETVVVEKAAK